MGYAGNEELSQEQRQKKRIDSLLCIFWELIDV